MRARPGRTPRSTIDFLDNEWQYKPVGFVPYGGVSGGPRAVQMVKQVVMTLKMTPVTEAVALPFVAKFVDDEGDLAPGETAEQSAQAMLDELRWPDGPECPRCDEPTTVSRIASHATNDGRRGRHRWSAMSTQREFDVVIVAEPEGGYSVFVPALPSVATQGETSCATPPCRTRSRCQSTATSRSRRGTLGNILRTAGISRDEFNRLI